MSQGETSCEKGKCHSRICRKMCFQYKTWNISITLHITSLKYGKLPWSLLLKGTKLQSAWVKVSATGITKGIESLKDAICKYKSELNSKEEEIKNIK